MYTFYKLNFTQGKFWCSFNVVFFWLFQSFLLRRNLLKKNFQYGNFSALFCNSHNYVLIENGEFAMTYAEI